MASPVVTVQAAFGSNPLASSYSWTTITTDVRTISYQRGRQNQLNRIDAGTGRVLLNDDSRKYDPDYSSSAYYPNVKPMVPIRATALINSNTYYLFEQYATGWPLSGYYRKHAERTVPTVDAFGAILARRSLDPGTASLITTLGGNRDLEYTARAPGSVGNSISVRYIIMSHNSGGSVVVDTVGTDITVYAPSNTASAVKNAINADPTASILVDCDHASGSDGSGTITAMSTSFLSGGAPGTYDTQLSSVRIQAVLDDIGFPSALELLGTGKSNVSPYTFPPGGTQSVLTHLQDVAGDPGEQGMLYVDGRGRVVFLNRHAFFQSPYLTSEATFSDQPSGGEYAYTDIVTGYDDDLIYNEWTGSRDGGVIQYVTDSTSIAAYGQRKAPDISFMLLNDNDVLALLQYGLSRYKDPMSRVESITVKPGNDTATWEAALGLELGDRITVKEHRVGPGSVVSRDYLVQQISAQFNPGPAVSGEFTFGLWPVDSRTWLTLNDSTYGHMDSTNQLAA